jgi:MFS family permease
MGDGRRDRRGLILLAMTVANAMVLVDQTGVPLILPSIIQRFDVGSQQVQWVLNASLLPLAGLLVFGGRLGDLIGRRRVFLLGSTVFAGASVCAGLAPTFSILLVFRVLQGAGGALMLPTTIAIVSAAYPGADRGRALGTMGGAAAVAGACGPVIGGALTSFFGWRSVLLINAPLAVLAVVATLRSVPADPVRERNERVDMAGTSLLSVALIGFRVRTGAIPTLRMDVDRRPVTARGQRGSRNRLRSRGTAQRQPLARVRAATPIPQLPRLDRESRHRRDGRDGLGTAVSVAAHPQPGDGAWAGGARSHTHNGADGRCRTARRPLV